MLQTIKDNPLLLDLLGQPYKLKAERCRRSLFYFVQSFWDLIIAEEPIYNWHIPYLCRELEKVAWNVIAGKEKDYDLIINIPPGTTKSTVAVVMLPAWVWCARLPQVLFPEVYEETAMKFERKLKKSPDDEELKEEYELFSRIGITGRTMRFITGSYANTLALEHAEYSRDLILSDRYKLFFPELQMRSDKNLKSNFRNIYGGQRFSTSVGATITGVHGHFLLVDDPLNPTQAISDAERDTANYWMNQTLSTRKVDKKITATILIMQRLHQLDCTGDQLEKKDKRFRHIMLPGEDSYEIKPPHLAKKYRNGLLDPIRLSRSVLEEMQTDLGSYGYAGQVGQDPRPREGGMFSKDWFEIVDAAPASSLPAVRGWDLAATSDKEAKRRKNRPAFTAGVKMSYHAGVFYIHDIARFRDSGFGVRNRMKNCASQDGDGVLIDFPQDPGQAGKAQAQDLAAELVGYNVRYSVESGDKVLRADPFSAQCEAGNVKLVRGQWNQLWLEEAGFFPNGFKDQIDAAVRAFSRLLLLKKMSADVPSGPRSVGGARQYNPDQGE